ncbi:MAG: glycosyltransferase family 4 protein [Sulfuricurvum sp.]|uniref:MraY family glycosyltransferase n=1 Tax=Sulfuricurvum sp. TaxID=2025608 RepID=UPI00260CD19B|nr:glycosyltransferase family 4 protein [Sulfuricurvum sp.]MDD2828064.1 glycosyltransferase family 4 protein [Sulfuricurvum sp.]MDD4948059.1 glycosyltransferase family 4 protein [Sulfuricurvum sp.]
MIYLILFALSIIITFIIRKYASVLKLIDIPNERSSHTISTPRGGGVAIIITFYTAFFYYHAFIESQLFWAICMGVPIAIIGFFDDIKPLPVYVRLSVQILSALTVLLILGGVNEIQFGFFTLHGMWLNGIAFLMIVWFTNLYNFLDGIDGYAASQTIFVSIAAFTLFKEPTLLFIIPATAGFLLFNRPKASIFMGDVGSTSLGFIFAIYMIHDASTLHFSGWLVVLSLFWFDATITLIRRWLNHEKLSVAHKKHMYQRLHLAKWSHQNIVLLGLVFNLTLFGLLLITPEKYFLVILGVTLLLLAKLLYFVDSKKEFL